MWDMAHAHGSAEPAWNWDFLQDRYVLLEAGFLLAFSPECVCLLAKESVLSILYHMVVAAGGHSLGADASVGVPCLF
jgi:hypothetical protein